MKKRGVIAFGVLFLVLGLALFSYFHLSSAATLGDYYVCCYTTDVGGSTSPNCASVRLHSACPNVGDSISNDCSGINSQKSTATVTNNPSVYHLTGNPLPAACDYGCPSGEEPCYVDGTHEGCITVGSGTKVFSGCTGTYYNNSIGTCELLCNPNDQFCDSSCSSATSQSACEVSGDCSWSETPLSCSSFTTKATCNNQAGCTAQESCTYTSSGGSGGSGGSDVSGGGQASTCSPGICASSAPAHSSENTSLVCADPTNFCYQCNPGYTQNGSSCYDLSNDPSNCGGVGIQCNLAGGETCNNGVCGCAVGEHKAPTGQQTFASCSGTYTSGSSCVSKVNIGASSNTNNQYQELALSDPCSKYGQTECYSNSSCDWTTYYSSCSIFDNDEATCNSKAPNCTSNYQPIYSCVANTCSDTDSGVNYPVKGTVSTNTDSGGTDFCFQSIANGGAGSSAHLSSGDSVGEYYCSAYDNKTAYIEKDCSNLSSGSTCSNGACINIPTCSDTDGGNKPSTPGTVTYNGNTYKDTCYDSSTISENYCSNGAWVSSTGGCPSGSSCVTNANGEGFCSSGCSDTDGGNNPSTPGTVTYNGNTYKDTCYDSSTISENYCSNGVWVSSTGGCSSGSSCVTNANGEGFCNINTKIADCETGCSFGSDCSSGVCQPDISGTNRCVPSSSTCALDTTTSCGVAQGFQQCYPGSTGNVKTCSSNGGWGTTDCGTFGCNVTTATCKAEVKNTWWGDSFSPCTSVPNPYTTSNNQDFSLVLRNGVSGIFNIFKNTVQINTSDGTLVPSTSCGDLWVGSWTFLVNSLNIGESANYSFTINGNQSDNLTITRLASTQGTYCGDGIVQQPNDNNVFEDCDGTNLTGNDCTTIGQDFTGGTLGCYSNGTLDSNGNNLGCTFDNSSCTSSTSSDLYCNHDNICKAPENSTTCPDDCPAGPPAKNGCDLVNYCGDYNSTTANDPQISCSQDLCSVAAGTPPPAGIGQVNKCQWDTSSSKCSKAVYESVNGKDVGYCVSEENKRTDDCSDGFLSYSWNSTWTWAPDNGPTAPNGDGSCNSSYIVVNGSCRYDPNGASTNCASGLSTIACPAQVELSFFDWRNVVAAVLIIFVLYVLLMKDKKRKLTKSKKRKVKKHSKKRKKK